MPVGPVEPRTLSLGVDWLILAFLGSVAVFTTLEKLFPKYRNQNILRPEWGLDLLYFCINHLAISAILIYANYHASHFDWAISPAVQGAVQAMPVWLQVVLIILCADFVLYWEHRLFHEVRWLWPVHAVHHSVEHMDWLAGSRGHFVQIFSERAMVMIPLYLLGASEAALNAYVAFAALQAVLIHCNLGLPFGPLKYLLVTPSFTTGITARSSRRSTPTIRPIPCCLIGCSVPTTCRWRTGRRNMAPRCGCRVPLWHKLYPLRQWLKRLR
ncbi:sterol desaturase family protein [Oceanimonas sp. NS1]|nr:sterol desaturase family protein [Oceanimonas sp. NS1]